MKVHFKLIVGKLLFFLLILSSNFIQAQCTTGCDVTNPSAGNYTFSSNTTTCFTDNVTLNDITFQNNSTLCIAAGVTVTVQNNIKSQPNNTINWNIQGTLILNQSSSIDANLNVNIASTGEVKAGSSGTNNFTFSGSGTNYFENNGTVSMGVLGFNSPSATNVIDNLGTYNIAGNINISGTTQFRNQGDLNIGNQFSVNSQSVFVNCGNMVIDQGVNMNGGTIINTGSFTGVNNNIQFGGNTARLENYGTLTLSNGAIQMSGSTSLFYNEGLAVLDKAIESFAIVRGPSDNSKKGYIKWNTKPNVNGGTIDQNLDIEYTGGGASATGAQRAAVFPSSPSPGGVDTNTVTYACEANSGTNCVAPIVTTGAVCRNPDGSVPVILTINAENDNFSTPIINPSVGGTTPSVFANNGSGVDLANGVAADNANIDDNISITNDNGLSGVSINTNGTINVPVNASAGTYTVEYQICLTADSSVCNTATVTIVVGNCLDFPSNDCDNDGVINSADKCEGFNDAADNDNDTIPDACDLDDDNDGILDTDEYCNAQPDELAWTKALIEPETDNNSEAGTIATTLNGKAINVNYNVLNSGDAGATEFGGDSYDYSKSVNADAGTTNVLNGNTQLSFYQQSNINGEMEVEFEITPGDFGNLNLFLVDFEATDFIVYAENSLGTKLSTLAWQVASYEQTGTSPADQPNDYIKNATDISFTSSRLSAVASDQNDDAMRVLFDVNTLASATKIVVRTIRNSANVAVRPNDNAEVMLTTTCAVLDTDNDGKPNYLDTDSDDDGCPDALEAAGNVLSTQLATLAAGSAGVGSSQLNLGVNSNNNGIPLPFGTLGGTEITGQATTIAMLDENDHLSCTTDLSLTKTVNNALPKVGDDIIYTLTLKNDGVLDVTGVIVKDVIPTGLAYKSSSSTSYDEGTDDWTIASLAPNTTISIQITATITGSGRIINKTEITVNNTVGLIEDVDSTLNNNK